MNEQRAEQNIEGAKRCLFELWHALEEERKEHGKPGREPDAKVENELIPCKENWCLQQRKPGNIKQNSKQEIVCRREEGGECQMREEGKMGRLVSHTTR